MSDDTRRPVGTAVIWSSLLEVTDELEQLTGRTVLDVLDVGGGTGGFAVPLAERGHEVTVVDPNPNALATLDHRAADAGVARRVRAVQGEAADLTDIVGQGSADLVICHGVLEVADEPLQAVHGLRAVLRPRGIVSVLVAQRYAAVLSRAAAGHLDDALEVLLSAEGRWHASDPLPRRYDEATITGLLAEAGLAVRSVHGVRIFTEVVPSNVVDEPATVRVLRDLETAAAANEALRSIAGQLHVLASL